MIGYMIEQELGNLLPFEVPFATILTMVEVDRDDPGFANPTKFIGPVYGEADAPTAEGREGLGDEAGRRASGAASCASPEPKQIFELRPIKWLLENGAIVIAAGGGGIPTVYEPGRRLSGHRGGDRQGPLLRAAGAPARGRPLHHGDRRRRGLRRLGQARAPGRSAAPARAAMRGVRLPGRLDGSQGRRRLPLRRARPASAPRSAR